MTFCCNEIGWRSDDVRSRMPAVHSPHERARLGLISAVIIDPTRVILGADRIKTQAAQRLEVKAYARSPWPDQ